MMDFKQRIESSLLIGIGPFILIFIYGWVKMYSFPLHDFSNTYFSAYLFTHGLLDTSIFDPGKFNLGVHALGFPSLFLSFNPNPPSTALLYAPFAFFEPLVSKFIFTGIGMAWFSLSLYRLAVHFKIPFGHLGLIPLIFYIPILNNILYGQTYFLIFSLLSEGYLQLEKGNRWKASLLWALAIFLKVFPLIVFCYLIFKKDWKTFGYLIISCLFLLLVCVGFQGKELWAYYFLTILPESFNGQITTPFVVSYQSFYMFLKFLLVKDKFLNPFPMWDNVPLFVYLNYLLKALLVFSTFLVLTKRSDIFGFGVLFLTVILILPYGSSYGNILLVFLYLNVLIDNKIGQMVWVSGVLFLISNLGIWYFESLPSIFRFPRLFLLGLLYLVLTVRYCPTLDWRWVLIFISPLIPWYIQLQKPPIRETELISTDDRPLLLDISLKNGCMNYDYWGHQGLKSVQTSINGNPGDAKSVSIRNNQIYFGQRQLTFSNGHKKSPIAMDSTVVFLSDLDKGMGFYSIWSVPIN